MTWRERTVVRILLIVARIVYKDPGLCEEIDKLANHISCAPADPGPSGESIGGFYHGPAPVESRIRP